MTLEDCRRFYAEEIRLSANISNSGLIDAFARVPREHFLGPGPWKVGSVDSGLGGAVYIETEDADPRHVYHNVTIALDTSRDLNNGQPAALAKWIDALRLESGERVFHLGCGVGYYTAIISEVVGSGGSVTASEIDPDLAGRASKNLTQWTNAEVHSCDGAELDPGTCDAILINAGVTHPHAKWLDSLREGGRLVVPLTIGVGMGANLGKGVMMKIVRKDEVFSAQVVTFVAIYSCTSIRDSKLEAPLGKALASGGLLKVKQLRRDPHEQEKSCVYHSDTFCLSSETIEAQSS